MIKYFHARSRRHLPNACSAPGARAAPGTAGFRFGGQSQPESHSTMALGQPDASRGPGSPMSPWGTGGSRKSRSIQAVRAALAPHWHASPLLQVILTSPTEVAKVRLQTQTQAQAQVRAQLQAQAQCWRSSASCPALPVTLGSGPKYRGPLHCLATVAREEGLRGLYKGSSALLLRDSFSFATYFLSYSILCEWLAPTGRSQPGEEGPGLGSGGSRASGDRGWEKEPWMSQARPPALPGWEPKCPCHRGLAHIVPCGLGRASPGLP